MKLMIAFAAFIAVCCSFNPQEVKKSEADFDTLFISAEEIQEMFPQCEIGDTVKVCIKSLYWRNGDGTPYSWYVPQPPGTSFGFPMEINFFEFCDNPVGGSGGQLIFFINLFEGESAQAEIIIGSCIEWGLAWMAPSIVCGQPYPLGHPAEIGIFDQNCENMVWPSTNLPLSLCPVDQYDPSCPTCPISPAPDTTNYMFLPGYYHGAKKIEASPICNNL